MITVSMQVSAQGKPKSGLLGVLKPAPPRRNRDGNSPKFLDTFHAA